MDYGHHLAPQIKNDVRTYRDTKNKYKIVKTLTSNTGNKTNQKTIKIKEQPIIGYNSPDPPRASRARAPAYKRELSDRLTKSNTSDTKTTNVVTTPRRNPAYTNNIPWNSQFAPQVPNKKFDENKTKRGRCAIQGPYSKERNIYKNTPKKKLTLNFETE